MTRGSVALFASLVASCAAFAGEPKPEPPTLYALDRDAVLHTVDPTNAAALTSVPVTLDGFSINSCNGLARHPTTGALYAVVRAGSQLGGSNDRLVTLDPESGVATYIGDLDDRFAGLAFLRNGSLIGVTGDGADEDETLFRIDIETGATSAITELGNGDDGEAIASTPGDAVFHASGAHSGEEYFERLNLGVFSGITDLRPSHSYGQSEEILALGWSDTHAKMFGADYNARNLFTIDLLTGDKTTIAPLDIGIKGLAFDGATLYAVDNPQSYGGSDPPAFFTIDPETGAILSTTPITLPGYTLDRANGLARQPGTGRLFAIVGEDSNTRFLVTIDPTSADATLIGLLSDKFAALAFRSDGALLAATGFGADVPKSLFTLDIATAQATFLRSLPNGVGGGQALAVASDAYLYHAAGYREGSQYFERMDPYSVTSPLITDIAPLSAQTFPFETAVQAMAWADTLKTMFLTTQSKVLYTVSTTSPAHFVFVGFTNEQYKGVAFDGATLYAATAFGARLDTIDPASGGAPLTSVNVTLAGRPNITSILGLARNPIDGLLYAIVRDTFFGIDERVLCTIDPATGVATEIGVLSDRFAGLAFRADGTLIGVTGTGAANPNGLYTISTATADALFLMSLPNGLSGGQAIAIASDGFLYHAAGIEVDDQHYERIDITTQTTEAIELPPVRVHSFPHGEALSLAYSTSLGAMFLADVSGDLYTIDTVTGESVHIGAFAPLAGRSGELYMKGLAFADPLIEPCHGDTNGDNVVDFLDLNNVLSSFGIPLGEPGYIPGADVNADEVVDFLDLNIVLSFFGAAC